MLKKVVGTTIARLINALISLIVIVILSKFLGAQGVGTIGLIILGITIILTINNFVGGGAFIYLVPRFELQKLIIPAYIWAGLVVFVFWIILLCIPLVPEQYVHHVLFLSLVQCLFQINFTILQGKEKIKQFNIITIFQVLILLLSLLYFIFYLDRKEVFSYVLSLYIAYSFSFIASIICILPFIRNSSLKDISSVIKQIFKYGFYSQFANVIQLFNYRFSYYVIELFSGRALLGIYHVGVQLSESLWLVGRSIAIVQYARISNSTDKDYSKMLTLYFIKFTFTVTLCLLVILLLLPNQVFVFVFESEFKQIGTVIASMAVGIIAVSVSLMLSHYFSGIGKHYHNTIGSAIGLVITLILSFILIPRYHLAGAGVTASVSYLAIMIYQLIVFFRISETKPKELMINRNDFTFLFSEIKNLFAK